jgi:hypothetical protein
MTPELFPPRRHPDVEQQFSIHRDDRQKKCNEFRAGLGLEHPQAKQAGDGIAGSEDVPGVAVGQKLLRHLGDVARGDAADTAQELLIARLKSIAGMQGSRLGGVGRFGSEPAVEFDPHGKS